MFKFTMTSSVLVACLMATVVNAQQDNTVTLPPILPLDQVTYHYSAEEWVTTKTAKVVVAINAALNEGQLPQVRNEIIQKLNKMNNATLWHITNFERSQDKSGLEQLQVEAEARLPEAQLTGMRQQAQSLSKPGETFSITTIDFTPTLAESETTKELLRAKVYTQVKDEIGRLSAAYPKQKFFIHTLNFSEVMPAIPMGRENVPIAMAANTSVNKTADTVMVSNKVILYAEVAIAAQSSAL